MGWAATDPASTAQTNKQTPRRSRCIRSLIASNSFRRAIDFRGRSSCLQARRLSRPFQDRCADLHLAAAVSAVFQVDLEDPLQPSGRGETP